MKTSGMMLPLTPGTPDVALLKDNPLGKGFQFRKEERKRKQERKTMPVNHHACADYRLFLPCLSFCMLLHHGIEISFKENHIRELFNWTQF